MEKLSVCKTEISSPLVHGCEMKKDESILSKRNAVKSAPQEILKLIYSTCFKRYVLVSCFNIQNGLLSTNTCTNLDCENYCDVDITDGQDDECSYDEENYEKIWNSDRLI